LKRNLNTDQLFR